MSPFHIPAGETLAQFLVRREHELTALISALEQQLGPYKAELAAIKKMKELADTFVGFGLKAELVREGDKGGVSVRISDPDGLVARAPIGDRFAKMTIKEMAVQALIDGFPDGAPLNVICQFIINGYRRPVEQASLRAQMHRMKADGVVTQNGEIWNLDPQKRRLYAQYDHPSTRAAMQELKDDPVPTDQQRLADAARRTIAGGAVGLGTTLPPAGLGIGLGQTMNEEADRLAQKEAKRARKKGDDFPG